MTISNFSEKLFDRYEVPHLNLAPQDAAQLEPNGGYPAGLPGGCIALSKDANRVGYIHVLIHAAQSIHRLLFGKFGDPDVNHGMVILDAERDERNRILVAHAIYNGIRTSKRDYLTERDVTNLIIYVPKSEKIRDLLKQYGGQTAYNPRKEEEEFNPEARFSFSDLCTAFFHNRKLYNTSNRVKQRLARAAADLIKGNAITNEKNRPRKLFCTAYAMLILQGSYVVSQLTDEQKEEMKNSSNVEAAAQKILELINNADTPLGKFYKEQNLLKLDGRFVMSQYADCQLSELSDLQKAKIIEDTPHPSRGSWLDRQAERIVDGIAQGSTTAKIIKFMLALPPAVGLLGLPLSLPLNKRISRILSIREFERLPKTPPEIHHSLEVKTKQQTFNHTTDFVIENGIIWSRPRGKEQAHWEPLYFDGYPNLRPKELHADGANLVVIDHNHAVHYKKILTERFDNDNREYHYVQIAREFNWKDEWYSFPLLKNILNIFSGKRLRLPEDRKGWAIGHRGQFTHFYNDAKGFKHAMSTGVTTLYVLDSLGKNIYMFDPWTPTKILAKIPVPERTEEPFVAENISASAAAIMLSGYVYRGEIKVPTIKTAMVDIDILGWDPALPYSYDAEEHEANNKVRILPAGNDEWAAHYFPENAIVSSTVTIMQTGEGNDERELRVPGLLNGVKGFFKKMIRDNDWEFTEDENIHLHSIMQHDVSPNPGSNACDWEGKDVLLESYIEDAPHLKLKFKEGEKYLHRRVNLIFEILTGGKNLHHYDLIDNEGKRKVPVKLLQKGDKLKIVKRGFLAETLYTLYKKDMS